MKARCVSCNTTVLTDSRQGWKDPYVANFDLSVGAEYVVAGMVLWGGVLCFLVADDSRLPVLAPALLFETTTQELPSDWEFSFETPSESTISHELPNNIAGKWGYPEMVCEYSHIQDLENGVVDALRIFYERIGRQ